MAKRQARGRQAPAVSQTTALELWVKAGGRCSFPGCNDYLLTDNLTNWRDTKHGQIAHIIAASEDGPRGHDPLPMEERSGIDNLILVCRVHHSVVDDKSREAEFPTWKLQQYKRDHEQRIYELTACKPDQQSKVIALTARIGAETVSASYDQICQAMFQQGRYPLSQDIIRIDLTRFRNPDSQSFYAAATEHIASEIGRALDGHERERKPDHYSVFAIGSMPLLVYLGAQVSNKVPTQLYQRHRDTQTWTWNEEPSQAAYHRNSLQKGTDTSAVALLLSLSGPVDRASLPSTIDERFFVYEIRLDGTPNPEFLRTPGDLDAFRRKYAEFLALVRDKHSSARTIHLFPAVPAPVAVLCGRELLHKIRPSLSVYDNKKEKEGFEFALEVD